MTVFPLNFTMLRPLTVLLAGVLLACGDSGSKRLYFVNRASWRVDSIVLSYNNRSVLGPIAQGETYQYAITSIHIPAGTEGIFTGMAYHGGKVLPFTWGFHDGYMHTGDETLYIFDHVVWLRDAPPAKPDSFEVFVINLSPELVDSVLPIAGKPIRIIENTPRNQMVLMPFDSIEKYRRFGIASGGRQFSTSLDFVHFDHWSQAQAILYFTGDSLTNQAPADREPLELIADLYPAGRFSLDDVLIEGAALIKVYPAAAHGYKRLVFDWKKLILDPHFQVDWKGKKHRVDLRRFGFPDNNMWQLTLTLDSNGARYP